MEYSKVTDGLFQSPNKLLTLEQFAERLCLTKSQPYEITRNRSRCKQAVPVPRKRPHHRFPAIAPAYYAVVDTQSLSPPGSRN
jgi:hypothetical protein